jgi:Asp/Glu/hydantoin racemase
MLGILTLDTAFPRIRGDIGAPGTFAFPVRHAIVRGAGVEGVVHEADAGLLPAFVDAAVALQAQGCTALTTTCGFLVRWQRELAAAVDVPVLTSALMQLPLVQRCVPRQRRVGVVTYSESSVTPALLVAAGADPATPVTGVDPTGYFAQTIRHGAAELDRDRMAADVVAAARRLAASHRDLGAVVLECANMPPYRDAAAAAIGLPVFDAVDLISWFYAGVAGAGGRDAYRDLW